jgi:hypothetical protein
MRARLLAVSLALSSVLACGDSGTSDSRPAAGAGRVALGAFILDRGPRL